jgi:DNA-binding MarR family transcriptional regulator
MPVTKRADNAKSQLGPDETADSALARHALEEFMAAWRGIRYGAEIDALRRLIYVESDEGLDVKQAHALDLVIELESCRVRDVAAALHVDGSTATRIIDRLVEQSLVVRTPDPNDGRGVVLSATAGGRTRHKALEARGRAMMRGVLEEFDLHEQLALAAYLRRLVDAAGRFVGGVTAVSGEMNPSTGRNRSDSTTS